MPISGLDAPLDLDRVALVGHSAGGYLAVWAATRAGLGDPGLETTGEPGDDACWW